ncbi:hypothetical protein BsWGS_18532 [Bradybaena similaris]
MAESEGDNVDKESISEIEEHKVKNDNVEIMNDDLIVNGCPRNNENANEHDLQEVIGKRLSETTNSKDELEWQHTNIFTKNNDNESGDKRQHTNVLVESFHSSDNPQAEDGAIYVETNDNKIRDMRQYANTLKKYCDKEEKQTPRRLFAEASEDHSELEHDCGTRLSETDDESKDDDSDSDDAEANDAINEAIREFRKQQLQQIHQQLERRRRQQQQHKVLDRSSSHGRLVKQPAAKLIKKCKSATFSLDGMLYTIGE